VTEQLQVINIGRRCGVRGPQDHPYDDTLRGLTVNARQVLKVRRYPLLSRPPCLLGIGVSAVGGLSGRCCTAVGCLSRFCGPKGRENDASEREHSYDSSADCAGK
jgi:hypothetical protein